MFAITGLEDRAAAGQPEVRAGAGRAAARRYAGVRPGYHLNKRHWNTVPVDGSLPDRGARHDRGLLRPGRRGLPKDVRPSWGWAAGRARPPIRLLRTRDEVASTGVTAPLVPEPPPPAPTASVPDADRPRTPRPLPWTGRGERDGQGSSSASSRCSGLLPLVLLPLDPGARLLAPGAASSSLRGSTASIINMGARARIGEASLVAAVLLGVPSLMMFDWLYWWAGRRWGDGVFVWLLGGARAEDRSSAWTRLHRIGGALRDRPRSCFAYILPMPSALIYAAVGRGRDAPRRRSSCSTCSARCCGPALLSRGRLRLRPRRRGRGRGDVALRAVGDARARRDRVPARPRARTVSQPSRGTGAGRRRPSHCGRRRAAAGLPGDGRTTSGARRQARRRTRGRGRGTCGAYRRAAAPADAIRPSPDGCPSRSVECPLIAGASAPRGLPTEICVKTCRARCIGSRHA